MNYTYEGKWKIAEALPDTGQSFTYLVRRANESDGGLYVLKRNKNKRRVLRFRDEVSALFELRHQLVAEIVDNDIEAETPWFVQHFYAGGNLLQFIKQNPDISWELAFDLFIQVSVALTYCHEKGLYHRDIKPANIFLTPDKKSIRLGDFGLCWIDNKSERATETSEVIGSLHYTPPEYADGIVEQPSPSGDIYQLGKVLYFMLSGGKIFDRERHRLPIWNLVFVRGEPSPRKPENLYLEHINLLLDVMITEDPGLRIPASEVLERIKVIKRLVMEKYNLTAGAKYAPCKYCGIGLYQPVAKDPGAVQGYFGLPASTQTPIRDFRALECDYCGHVQLFRSNPKNDWLTN